VQSKIDIFKENNRKEFSDKLLCITEKLKAYQKYISNIKQLTVERDLIGDTFQKIE
jgi:hypothetical protein